MNNDFQESMTPEMNQVRTRYRIKKSWIRPIVETVVLVLLVVSLLYIWNLRSENANLTSVIASDNANPQALVQKQTNQIVSAVQALLGSKVPTNEVPVIATVTDASAVQKQAAFFSSAQNGDKVLFYTKNGLVILYRPSQNLIVADGPLTFNK